MDSLTLKEKIGQLVQLDGRFFGAEEVPDLLKKLKSSAKEDQVAQSMVGTLIRISTLHDSLIQQQNEMAKAHGLLQIQVSRDAQFFLSRGRE